MVYVHDTQQIRHAICVPFLQILTTLAFTYMAYLVADAHWKSRVLTTVSEGNMLVRCPNTDAILFAHITPMQILFSVYISVVTIMLIVEMVPSLIVKQIRK